MKFILDTHVFLWTLFDDEKLSDNSKGIIRNIENDIYVSTITFWEISLKYAIGKLELENITPEELPGKAKEINIETMDLSGQDAASFYKLPRLKHKDTFDRLIIWQAINKNITLISKDKMMPEYRKYGLRVLW